MKKINPLFISGCLLLVAPAMSATLSGTLAPTVVPLTNGGQANIAVSNTDPNLFTVPGDRITASPLARRIAADKGAELAGLPGTGPNGRIVKADVEGAQPGATTPAPAASAAAPGVTAAPARRRAPGTCRSPRSRAARR